MNEKERTTLVKIRLEDAKSLYNDACNMYRDASYKSANNRAYYSLEKSVKALLALKGVDATTHNGVLQLFNRYYIYEDGTFFTKEDYKTFASVEIIRSASDYDDFYIASKSETEVVLNQVSLLNKKIRDYVELNNIRICNETEYELER